MRNQGIGASQHRTGQGNSRDKSKERSTPGRIFPTPTVLPLRAPPTLRRLLHNPLFTITVLATLAFGLGAGTAMYSTVHTLLLAPLPYPEAHRLISLSSTNKEGQLTGASLVDLEDWAVSSLEHLAGYRRRSFGLRTGEDAKVRVVEVGMVTSEFLAALGVPPSFGRFFSRTEEQREEALIVLSDGLWRQALNADPDVVGRRVELNEVPYTVLGILPPGFAFPMDGYRTEALIPLSHRLYGHRRGLRSLEAVGRLREGVALEAAGREFRSLGRQLAAAFPETNADRGVSLRSFDEALRGVNRRALVLLSAAAALLLLIACSNVAHLLVARHLGQRHQLAVRQALGARPGQLVRQFLKEALLLSSAGAALGLLVAQVSLALLPTLLPLLGGRSGDAEGLSLEPAAFLFALALAVFTAILSTLVPTLLAHRLHPTELLGQATTAHRTRWRGALVVAQIASCVVLLLGSGLLLRSFVALLYQPPGFETAAVLRFGIGLPEARYDSDAKMASFHRRLSEELGSIPGVEAVGAMARLPLGGGGFRGAFRREGDDLPRERWPRTAVNILSPGTLEALRIPLITGRPFTWDDTPESPRILLVNKAWQRLHAPDSDPVGEDLVLNWSSSSHPAGSRWEIVGIVGDIHQRSLEEAPEPEVYLSMGQFPSEGGSYTVRTALPGTDLAAAVDATVARIDPDLQRVEAQPLHQVFQKSLEPRRVALGSSGAFALLALLLTTIGLYGVVAAGVVERRRELAIRRALGARRKDIVWLVLALGLRLGLVGLTLGWLAFLAVHERLAPHLVQTTVHDLPTHLGTALLILTVTALASWMPSQRAVRRPPASLLHGDNFYRGKT